MKSFYSAQEIEDLARQGVRELLVDDNVVLTDLARQTAGQLGVRLVAGKPNTATSAPGHAPSSASAPLPAKPKGCQHGAGSPKAAVSGPGTTTGASSQVVDDLVGLVKQMSKR